MHHLRGSKNRIFGILPQGRNKSLFFQLGEEDVCFMLVSDLVHSVTDHKPAQIHLFDYYNPQDQVSYRIPRERR